MLTLFFFPPTIKSPLPKQGHANKNKGFGSVEFLLVATPILMLGMGSLEASYWYIARQASSLALLEAARTAATNHANPHTIELAFEKALHPLFSPTGNFPDPAARMQSYFNSIKKKTGQAPWRIVIQSPDQADFIDFQRKDLSIAQQTGLPAIDNNYQYEQYQRTGTGNYSGNNIFQANTLQIELTYPYQPLIPGISQLFKVLVGNGKDYDRQLMNQGILPIKQTLSISMQSHPVLWPVEPGGKVLYSHTSMPISGIGKPQTGNLQTCTGLWCGTTASNGTHTPTRPDTTPPNHQPVPAPNNPQIPESKKTGGNTPSTPEEALPEEKISVEGQDPACDVNLCCT
ncbi:MAG: TadE family protein [Advenella sp.]